MLIPAALKKEEIAKAFQKFFYTDDMMFETGSLHNWSPDIQDCPDACTFQYAIVNDEDKLLGYLAYTVDWYSDIAYNFGMISFDRGNVIFGKDITNKIIELVEKHHKVTWRMVGGNPVEKHYDKIIKKYNGNKFVLKDAFKDREGKYRNDTIYEIIKED